MRVTLVSLALGAASATLALASVSNQQHFFKAGGNVFHHQEEAGQLKTSWEMVPGTLYNEQRLIKVSETTRPRWMDLESILVLRRAGVRFMDITDTQGLHLSYDAVAEATEEGTLQYKSRLPQELVQEKNVAGAVSLLSTELYGKVLEPFTAFHNRYYDSENGRKSSEWLKKQVEQLVAGANVTVSAFKHRFPQSSLVARIEGRGAKDETVVISAHQDSVNQWIPWFGRASGADDDGSGTVTILEALRVLLENGFAPSRSVEFHWYAGEEGGLLGSQDVALAYKNEGRKVAANMHFDMTGFWLKDSQELIGLVADRTDAETRKMVKALVEKYTRLRTKEFSCGYGCSDHSSWNSAGYRSAMAFESDKLDANTYIHSPSDTVETLDFVHMLEFSKLAVAFAYEVGYVSDNA